MQDVGEGGTGGNPPSNAPTEKRDMMDPLDDENIPIYQPGSQAMAMFVPLEYSLFEPFEAPKDNGERLKISLEVLEKHTSAVHDNIVFVYERERRRILRHAKTLEAANGIVETDVGMSPGEEELMMAYVKAPIPNDADYSTRRLSTYTPPSLPPDCPPRQAAILWSLYNAGQELTQLAGYAGHAQTIKDEYKAALAKELAVVGSGPAEQATESEPALGSQNLV